jgi:hypothetical protein
MNTGDFMWFNLDNLLCDRCGGGVLLDNVLGVFESATHIGPEIAYNFSVLYDITCPSCGLEIAHLVLRKAAVDIFNGRITNSR